VTGSGAGRKDQDELEGREVGENVITSAINCLWRVKSDQRNKDDLTGTEKRGGSLIEGKEP